MYIRNYFGLSILLFCLNISIGQNKKGIIIQEIYSPTKLLSVDSLDNIFSYDKVFSDKTIKEGKIKSHEIEEKLKLFSQNNKLKNTYFLEVKYSKDYQSIYVESSFNIKNNIMKEIISFGEFSKENFNYDCEQVLYEDIIFYKEIGFDSKIIISFEDNTFRLSVIDNNCRELLNKKYDNSLKFWDKNDLLILSYYDQSIIYHSDNI
jgi:hypothetical protein